MANTSKKYKKAWKDYDNALAAMSLGEFRGLFDSETNDWLDYSDKDKKIPAFINWLEHNTQKGEVESWINSWPEMYKVLKDKHDFSDNCWIILEYKIKPTNKRVDFILCCKDKNDVKKIIIIELKQWDSDFVKKPETGKTVKFSKFEYSPKLHPSLQAIGYKSLIKSYNEFVSNSDILIKSCAYLFNWDGKEKVSNWIEDFYKNYTNDSPLFYNSEKFKSFLLIHDAKSASPKNNTEYNKLKKSEDIAISFLKSNECHKDLINIFDSYEQFYLVDEQAIVASQIIDEIDKKNEFKKVMIVYGGPGSGKSAVALAVYNYLINNEAYNDLNVKFPITTNSFRECLIERINNKEISNDISKDIIATKDLDKWGSYFDVLICDEAHRLKDSEFNQHWDYGQILKIIEFGKNCIFFIDDEQSIVQADEGSLQNIVKIASQLNSQVNLIPFWVLCDQYRCNGSNEYINWIDKVLCMNKAVESCPTETKDSIKNDANCHWEKFNFEFKVFDNPKDLKSKLDKDEKVALLTGDSWKWDKKSKVVEIDKYDFKMNTVSTEINNWANKPNLDAIGTVHDVQGMEFDFVGVIIKEDWESLDTYTKRIYKILLTRGTKGCYVYCCNKDLEEHFVKCLKAIGEITKEDGYVTLKK